MRYSVVVIAGLVFGAGLGVARGADQKVPEPLGILQDRPDKDLGKGDTGVLGKAFESKTAGIAMRPPAGCKQIVRGGSPDDIVEFVNDQKNWSLKVSRSTLSQPVPLDEYFDNGRKMPGVLQMTAENFKRENATAEVVREDVIDLGLNKVGMFASRTMLGGQRRLFQQAIIHATDTQYYVLLMNSPAAAKGAEMIGDKPDPKEADAVGTFKAVLDTVQLLDRSSIKEDQDQRLFRARAFFVNLTDAKIKRVLVPEQWFRLIRDGKDIGYTYVIEEPYKQGGNDGVRIGMRSRTMPDKGMQVDTESWMFSSMDRRHETWTNVAAIGDGVKTKDYSSEVGYSDVEFSHHVEKDEQGPGQKYPPIVTEETHTLTVTRSSKSATQKPITRPVPPWYLTAAMGHLLPRLLPTDVPRGYMFATYVSEAGEVMSRYVDIGRPVQVAILPGEAAQEVVPVKDRIGLEGSVTTYYVTPAGKYVGAVNEDSKVTIASSDRETILKLWANADLTRPKERSDSRGTGGK
jgi:hypothetical protein